jgi:pSer/pThr/pTyr-binding forkhead associated (FHA) protein
MSGLVVLVLRGLLALTLYVFLGLTLWTIWQDLKRTSRQTKAQPVPAIHLQILLKNEPSLDRHFTQAVVVLGRSPECDLAIEDEALSAHHAEFSFHHGQWWLKDLNSKNGTRLNRSKLNTSTVLTTGDEIKCGKVRILVNLERKAFQ